MRSSWVSNDSHGLTRNLELLYFLNCRFLVRATSQIGALMRTVDQTGSLFLVVFIGILFESPLCRAEEGLKDTAKKLDVVRVKRMIVFDETGDERRKGTRGEVQLGEYLPGKVVECTIDVDNRTKRSLDFSRVEPGCTCLSVSPTKGELAPGERLSLKVVVRTPSNPSKVEQSATFAAFKDKLLRFVIRATYSASGVVGFTDKAVQVRVPKGSGKYDIELSMFADSLSPRELIDLRVSESLKGITAHLDYQNRIVRVSVPESTVVSERITGELTIENIETRSSDTILLDASIQRALSVFPSILRFYPVEQDGETRFICRLSILDRNRLAGSEQVSEKQQPGKPSTSSVATAADFFHGKTKLKSRLVRCSGAISFYEISASERQFDEVEKVARVRCVMLGKASQDSVSLPFTLHKSRRP